MSSWEEKIPLVQGGLERAWLFHEIGRCYLELKRFTKARDYGIHSLSAANDIGDEKWQLNASVLVAQAECESITRCIEHYVLESNNGNKCYRIICVNIFFLFFSETG